MHQPTSLEVKFVSQDVWVYAAMHAFSHAAMQTLCEAQHVPQSDLSIGDGLNTEMTFVTASGFQMSTFLKHYGTPDRSRGLDANRPSRLLERVACISSSCMQADRLDLKQIALKHLQLQCWFHAKQSWHALQHIYTA
jgi:hypothetical protein